MHKAQLITNIQCIIYIQLDNKPRVVVTDFRLHHSMVSLNGAGMTYTVNVHENMLNLCQCTPVMYIHMPFYSTNMRTKEIRKCTVTFDLSI